MRRPFALLFALALTGAANAATIEMQVNGLVCAFCAQGIEKILKKNPATTDVVVSLEEKLVAVETRDGQDIPDAELKKTLTDAGYTVKTIKRTKTPLAKIRERLAQKTK